MALQFNMSAFDDKYIYPQHPQKIQKKHIPDYSGKEFVADASLIQLVNQCREIDERFNEIDMEHLYCNNEPHGNNFCTDLKKVEACVEVARNIRDLVHLEPWPLSRRVK